MRGLYSGAAPLELVGMEDLAGDLDGFRIGKLLDEAWRDIDGLPEVVTAIRTAIGGDLDDLVGLGERPPGWFVAGFAADRATVGPDVVALLSSPPAEGDRCLLGGVCGFS